MIPALTVRLLSLVIWVGGLIFFAFVLAPTAFHVLPSTHEAGLVVAGTLNLLHPIGQICGAVFLIASALLWSRTPPTHRRLLAAELCLVLLMMLTTGYVQFSIVPAMERDRIAAGGNIDAAPADNPARQDFERLHPISEKVEGTALLLGLAAVILLANEPARA